MLKIPSFISNSEPSLLGSAPSRPAKGTLSATRRNILATGKLVFWLSLWLALIDIGVGTLFRYPRSPQATPSRLQRYFNYGTSIEGKLNHMVGETVAASAQIVRAGWLQSEDWQNRPATLEAGDDLFVAAYGMSFTKHVMQSLGTLDPKITQRIISAPTAPPNHSFKAYFTDRAGRSADVAVVGILASSLQRMRGLSGINWTPESPTPYTYPYYSVDADGQLIETLPVLATQAEFQEAFQQKGERWQAFVRQLDEYDRAYNPAIFRESWLDRSTIARLIRRSLAKRTVGKAETGFYAPALGFAETPELQALRELIEEFARVARSSGQVPVIVLHNDRGYADHLYLALKDRLDATGVLTISTHDIVPAADLGNFLADGHFTEAADLQTARVLHQALREATAIGQAPTPAIVN